MTEGVNHNSRVRVAEVKRDTEHLTSLVRELRDEQREHTSQITALRDHFDARMEALRDSVSCVAQGLAVLETRQSEYRAAHAGEHAQHVREHERERGTQTRRNLIVDAVSAAIAAAAGIFIQPGRGP